MTALTDMKAKALKPGDRKVPDGTVKGLWLHPTAQKGTGNWIFRFTSPTTAKRREMGLGAYPNTSIAAAREDAKAARALLDREIDPIDARNAEKAREAVAQAHTFEAVARQYYETKRPGWKDGKHVAQWMTSLETYVFPHVGHRRVETLTKNDFVSVMTPIWQKIPQTAQKVKQRCEAVMKWCLLHDMVASNPVIVVGDILARQNHEKQPHPAVDWKDLPAFVRDILNDGTIGTCREILEATILTGARSKEIRGMRWEEIDFEKKVWNVPPIRMKNKKPHQVPLSWRMIEILNIQRDKSLHPELVFPSPTGKLFSDNTLSKFLRDHKIKSDVPGRYATVHGFRSTFRTWGTDHLYDRDMLEKALAHTEKNDLVATYSRTNMLDQRRKLMEDWADFTKGKTQATAITVTANTVI